MPPSWIHTKQIIQSARCISSTHNKCGFGGMSLPHNVKIAKHRLKTCNAKMLHDTLRVFVSRISIWFLEVLCFDQEIPVPWKLKLFNEMQMLNPCVAPGFICLAGRSSAVYRGTTSSIFHAGPVHVPAFRLHDKSGRLRTHNIYNPLATRGFPADTRK